MAKCAVCKTKFKPKYSSLQKTCGINCAIEYAQAQNRKAVERQRKAIEKQQRHETREAKEQLKTRRDYLKETQSVCNSYIRERDKLEGCISCDKPANWQGQWHASHYRPTGNCGALRYHEMNIHKSCSECNNHKSGNLVEYRIKLIQKIGLKNVEWLESQNDPYKWDVDDVKEIKAYFKAKKKFLLQ